MRGKGVTIGARGTSSISSLISGMTLRERRALHESVKRRILSEADTKSPIVIQDGKYSWRIEGDRLFMTATPNDERVTDQNSKEITDAKTKDKIISVLKEKYPDKFKTPAADAAAATDTPSVSAAAPAAPSEEEKTPSDESPVGSTLMKGSTKVFEKTAAGWKATLRLTLPQILSIVKPDYQAEVKKDLMNLPERDELPITKGYLKNPSMVFTGGGLTFQRDGEVFADPVAIPGDKINNIKTSLGLKYSEAESRDAESTVAGEQRWAVGNVIFKKEGDQKMTITVKDDGSGTYTDFNSIFGAGANVPGLIQKAAKKNKGRVDMIKIPLKFADESSLMGKFGGFLGMGSVRFEKGSDADSFVCTLEKIAVIERAVATLDEMSGSGLAKSLKT